MKSLHVLVDSIIYFRYLRILPFAQLKTWEILKKTSDIFGKMLEIFWIISDVFCVLWEKISCLMGEVFCSMGTRILVGDNELLVKSNNIEEIFGEFWGWKLWFLCSQMGGKVETEWRRENHNIMRGKNGALARARTRTPCNFALFAFTTFTKSRVRGSKWGVYDGNRNDVRENVIFECWKGRKNGWFCEERRYARNCGFRGSFCAVLWRLWKQKSRNPCYVRARRVEKLTRDFAGLKKWTLKF